jgi:lysophospholipase
MGGLAALRFVLSRQGGVEGAVVSSPLLAPHPSAEPSQATRLAARLLSKIAPGLLLPSDLNAGALSRDPAVVDAYTADPLVSHKVSARWYVDTMATADEVRAQAPLLRVPVLLMQSGGDRLVDPAATRRWAQAAPPEQVQFVWWEDLYHEMFNEPERHLVYDRTERWLTERMSGTVTD